MRHGVVISEQTRQTSVTNNILQQKSHLTAE